MTPRPHSKRRSRPATARSAPGATRLGTVQLGAAKLGATKTRASKSLDVFPNPRPGRDYEIRFECPEFTCLCPKTGQPDFATIRIRYTPEARCVELKSLKLYLWSFRDEGHFHEDVTNRILDDLVSVLAPRRLVVEGDFLVRGGIHTVVEVRYPDA